MNEWMNEEQAEYLECSTWNHEDMSSDPASDSNDTEHFPPLDITSFTSKRGTDSVVHKYF